MAKTHNRSVRIAGRGSKLLLDRYTGTDASQAVTIHGSYVVITSSTANLGADTSETITLTNRYITANSHIIPTVSTTGTGAPVVSSVVPAAGSCTIVVRNVNAGTALNAVYILRLTIIGDGRTDRSA